MLRFPTFVAFLVSLIPAPASAAAPKVAVPDHHNIVLFIADDLSWHDIGPYGATDVKTPNLDRFATESMLFTQAIATSPTCTPSRCGIFTGLYPFKNGAHANHSLVREGVKTLPSYMKDLGYRVVIAGKTHIGPREQFEFEYLKGSNVMPAGKDHVLWTDLDTGAVDKLLAEHDKKVPLCLIVCSHSPHVYWPENVGDGAYDAAEVKLPPYLLDTPETRAARCRYYEDVSWMDKQFGDVLDSLDRHGFPKNYTLTIFTSDQGAQWPFAKWNLYDAGVRVPLIARWGRKTPAGNTTSSLVSLADLLPTILDAAGGDPESWKDLDGESFLGSLIGLETSHRDAVYATHTGDKQMNRSPARCVRTERYKYILNLKPDAPFKTHISDAEAADGRAYWNSWERLARTDAAARAVVDRYRHRPAEELYDVEADPYELKNLSEDPNHAQDLEQMRERVRTWRQGQGEDLNRVAMPEDARVGPLPYAE
jgi:arylsulfatase A-like enzyme